MVSLNPNPSPNQKGTPKKGVHPIVLLLMLAGCMLLASHLLDQESETGDRSVDSQSSNPTSEDREDRTHLNVNPNLVGNPSDSQKTKTENSQEENSLPDPNSLEESSNDSNQGSKFKSPVLSIRGRILDSNGRAISGAKVSTNSEATQSDSLGEFVLPRTATPLVIEKEGFFSRTLSQEERIQQQTTGNRNYLLIVLFEGGKIRGKVLTENGEVLSGAKVAITGSEGVGIDSLPTPVFSKNDGSFESQLLSPGLHHVHITHAQYQGWEQTVAVNALPKWTQVQASLVQGEEVLISVTDPKNNPLPDVLLTLIHKKDAHSSETSRRLGYTGDRGTLLARWGKEGEHRVQALIPGFQKIEREVSGNRVQMSLSPAPLLNGSAIDKLSGEYVEIKAVELEFQTPTGFMRVADRGLLFHTLEKGRFKLGLAPFSGKYRVKVRGGQQLEGVSEVLSFDGMNSPRAIEVSMVRQGGLKGKVSFQGKPIQDVRIELYKDRSAPLGYVQGIEVPSPPPILDITLTNALGDFKFGNLPQGSYRLRMMHADYSEIFSAPWHVPSVETRSFELQKGATLSGRVEDARGTSQPDMPIVLVQLDRPFPRSSTSNGEGEYRFDRLPDGKYLIFFGDPTWRERNSSHTWLPEGAEHRFKGTEHNSIILEGGRDLTFNLKLENLNWGSLLGEVLRDGAPIKDLSLRIQGPLPDQAGTQLSSQNQTEKLSFETQVQCDKKGRFKILGLTPGLYRVSCDYPPILKTIRIQAGDKNSWKLDLTPRPVKLSLTDKVKGEWVKAKVKVAIYNRELGKLVAQIESPELKTTESQKVDRKLPDLFPGKYRVRIVGQGYLPEELEVEVDRHPIDLKASLRKGYPVKIQDLGENEKVKANLGSGFSTIVILKNNVELLRYRELIKEDLLLPDLEPGSYQLVIHLPQGGTLRKTFTVSAK